MPASDLVREGVVGTQLCSAGDVLSLEGSMVRRQSIEGNGGSRQWYARNTFVSSYDSSSLVFLLQGGLIIQAVVNEPIPSCHLELAGQLSWRRMAWLRKEMTFSYRFF